ncbi:unnamed protein product [Protopolystoma xenopodis]|uniref:Uncharacterized protein n=1 Tax=Protopolystoma xenopodis TaxID=117903 RepID=A0A448WXU3_9PLAT|nr:unnamed protein product [Protopolystoma xenopodis]
MLHRHRRLYIGRLGGTDRPDRLVVRGERLLTPAVHVAADASSLTFATRAGTFLLQLTEPCWKIPRLEQQENVEGEQESENKFTWRRYRLPLDTFYTVLATAILRDGRTLSMVRMQRLKPVSDITKEVVNSSNLNHLPGVKRKCDPVYSLVLCYPEPRRLVALMNSPSKTKNSWQSPDHMDLTTYQLMNCSTQPIRIASLGSSTVRFVPGPVGVAAVHWLYDQVAFLFSPRKCYCTECRHRKASCPSVDVGDRQREKLDYPDDLTFGLIWHGKRKPRTSGAAEIGRLRGYDPDDSKTRSGDQGLCICLRLPPAKVTSRLDWPCCWLSGRSIAGRVRSLEDLSWSAEAARRGLINQILAQIVK